MNKSVYLYELDSVRNSKEEIQYAQERMFREIYTEWEPGDPDHESVSGFSCISCCD